MKLEPKPLSLLLQQQRPLNQMNVEGLTASPDASLSAEANTLKELLETQRSNDEQLSAKTRRLTLLENRPDETKTTVRRNIRNVYPADQNPNIIATQQILAIERLNNALRVNTQ